MKNRVLAIVAALMVSLSGMNAYAVEEEVCSISLTGALASSGSSATGTYQLFLDEQANTVRVRVTHNVTGATSIELRNGLAGQTGTLISNLGGATGTDVSYTLTSGERPAFEAAFPASYYIIVSTNSFPAPGGEIRADALACSLRPEGEAEVTEGEVPEGLLDYECALTLTGAQVVPPVATSATGTVNITFESANKATLILFHDVTLGDIGNITIYEGAPGETGTPVRRIASGLAQLLMTVTKAELETYTSTPHYVEVESLSGDDTIRADIVGCAFDDGVEEGEGVQEGEGEGQGEQTPCEVLPVVDPGLLQCEVVFSGTAVVPPTTSPYIGGVQITGPFEDQYLLQVRHNVPNPTSINLYRGAPGQTGELFQSFTSNLGCPFQQLLASNFLTVLANNPLYVEVASAADSNATVRADLICPEISEGQLDGEGDQEGTPDGGNEGEGEGQGNAGLEAIADGLLLVFHTADGSQNGLLEFAEASFAAPIMTQEQFLALDDNDDQALSTGELHRYAGPVRKHNGDIDGDFTLDVSELLRMIQLYNAGGYSCVDPAGSTEDGFAPGTAKGDVPLCKRHAADYLAGGDFKIDLSELLRVIQLFNFGTYAYCETPTLADDNYCINGELLFP